MSRSDGVGAARRVGEAAVVVGASMAGLCAARVLSERFGEVLVVDRDVLPGGPEWRRHVPQGRHPHLLLPTGARLLEGWFPGLVEELLAGGAVDVDICGDFYWHQSGGAWRRPRSPLRGPAMSRPFLEWAVRRRVDAIPNVTIRGQAGVTGLEANSAGTRIVGVRFEDGSDLGCGLVVDATGRQARSLAWLGDLGYAPPPTSIVEVDARYVTRVLHRSDRPRRDWKGAAVIGDPPSKRLAMALPVEGDRWILAFGGLNGEAAPTDDEAMLEYSRTFDSPVITEILETSEPIGEVITHRFPANHRRHVEKLRRFPGGWLMIGDAVCSFDPIYGQGMTSAAYQARALGKCLDRSATVDRGAIRRYFRAASRNVSNPWSIAVGGDFAYDGTTGKKPAGTDVSNRYMSRLAVAAQHEDAVVIRLNEVMTFLRSPASLMSPVFAARALRAARRGPAVPVADTARPEMVGGGGAITSDDGLVHGA